jgi:steroid delta-isomerase-like uncharacterized protein
MTPEEACAIAIRCRVELPRKPELADEILAPGFVLHALDPITPPLGMGADALKMAARLYISAVPDMEFKVEDIVASGDRVSVRWASEGTHTARLMGFPATRKRLKFRGIDMFRISDGKIQEAWTSWDVLGVLPQLGFIPALGALLGLHLGLFPRLPLWFLRRSLARQGTGSVELRTPGTDPSARP